VQKKINDIFKPKSEEDIKKSILAIHITGIENANTHLKKAISLGSILYVKHALKHGAQILKQKTTGILWLVFNKFEAEGLEYTPIPEEIIIEFLKNSNFFENGVGYIGNLILEKSICFGFTKVLKYILNNYNIRSIDIHKALFNYHKERASYSVYENPESAKKLLKKWLQRQEKISESLGDILKPKSEEEIVDVLKNMTYEDYEDFVNNMLDEYTEPVEEMYSINAEIDINKFIKAGFKNLIAPSKTAKNILEYYYKNTWKPHGGLALTNTGGIEIKVNDTYELVQYRFTGEIIPHISEIEYEILSEEDDKENYDYYGGVRAFFKTESEITYYLDEFMKI